MITYGIAKTLNLRKQEKTDKSLYLFIPIDTVDSAV